MSTKKEEIPTKTDGSEQLISNLEMLADVISNRLMGEFTQAMGLVKNDLDELSRQTREINSRMDRINNTVVELARRQQRTDNVLLESKIYNTATSGETPPAEKASKTTVIEDPIPQTPSVNYNTLFNDQSFAMDWLWNTGKSKPDVSARPSNRDLQTVKKASPTNSVVDSDDNNEKKLEEARKKHATSTGGFGNGGGGDDEPDDNSNNTGDRKDSKKKSDDRRKSINGTIAEWAPRRSGPMNMVAATVIKTQPSTEHIMLHRLTPRALVVFGTTYVEYLTKHGISLSLVHQLARNVVKELLAHHPRLTLEEFYSLDNARLLQYLQVHVRPRTSLEFMNVLERNVHFEYDGVHMPSVTYYDRFYAALLIFKEDFLKYYELMAEHNDDNVPPCNDKDGGLVKFYTNAIPFEYGRKLLVKLKQTKFADIYVFLQLFYKIVENDFDLSTNARKCNEHFGGTAWRARAFNYTPVNNNRNVNQHHGNSNSTRNVLVDRNNYGKKSSTPHRDNNNRNNHKLSAIAESTAEDDDEAPYIAPVIDSRFDLEDSRRDSVNYQPVLFDSNGDDENGIGHDFNTTVDNNNNNLHLLPNGTTSIEDEDDDDFDRNLAAAIVESHVHAMTEKGQAHKLPRGCLYKALYDECKLGSRCPYSHDMKGLQACVTYYSNLWSKSKYKSSTPSILKKKA